MSTLVAGLSLTNKRPFYVRKNVQNVQTFRLALTYVQS